MPRKLPEFEGFLGQRKNVRLLKKQLGGAMSRGEPLPPTLMTGPSGVGKTKLAEALAKASGKKFTVVSGRYKAADLADTLRRVDDGDIVFIDECHALKIDAQELLFEVIDNNRVTNYLPNEKENPEQEESPEYVAIKTCTLVFATDRPGKLLDALIRRIHIHVSLCFYPLREMQAICDRIATDLKILLSPQARNQIARISKGLPRVAKHNLGNLRRHFVGSEQRTLTLGNIRKFMTDFGIERHGLDREDRRYLKLLMGNKCVSIESIATQLGSDNTHLRRQVEPVLLRMKLITVASSGRTLTERGKQLIENYKRKKKENKC